MLIKRLRENSGRPDYGAPALVAILSLAGVRGHVLLDLRLHRFKIEARAFLHAREFDRGLRQFRNLFLDDWKRQN